MLIIGLAGGVASGKSLVADYFQQLGAVALNADRAVHDALRDGEVKEAIRGRWGEAAFDDEGHVDRAALAKIVFAPPPEGPEHRAALEGITHPRVEAAFRQRIDELAEQGTVPAVVIDAPLLLEAGWADSCDKIVFVHTPAAERLRRATARGWTEADFAAREAAQQSLQSKREAADVVLDNSGPVDETYAQIDAFWREMGQGGG